jgi:hypothetical protein
VLLNLTVPDRIQHNSNATLIHHHQNHTEFVQYHLIAFIITAVCTLQIEYGVMTKLVTVFPYEHKAINEELIALPTTGVGWRQSQTHSQSMEQSWRQPHYRHKQRLSLCKGKTSGNHIQRAITAYSSVLFSKRLDETPCSDNSSVGMHSSFLSVLLAAFRYSVLSHWISKLLI